MANSLLVSLEGHWTMDEATNRLDDVNGNTASPGVNPVQGSGLLGNAAENPSASNRHLLITNDSALVFDDESFSISAWIVKFTASDTSGQILGLWEGNGALSYTLTYNKTPDALQFELTSDGFVGTRVTHLSSVTLTNNTWYHVVAVLNVDTELMKIYVTPSTESSPASAENKAHTGGVYGGVTDPIRMFLLPSVGEFPGRIDEVAVWRRALTDGDVNTLFNQGAPLPYSQWQDGTVAPSIPPNVYRRRKRKNG